MARNPSFPSFRHEVDRLFDSLIHTPWGGRTGEVCWMPAANVAEEPNEYRLEVDVPGVKASDLSITTEGRVLRIEGVRERARQLQTARHHLIERTCGRFIRTFRMPDDAATEEIRARLAEGVLTIEIPRLREDPGGPHD